MTKEEREAFLADVHVGVISVAEDGHGPLTVPVWYSYEPGGEVRIITARRPADLPVERPDTFEIVLNLRVANALGLAMPRSFVLRADEVIR